MKDECVSDVKKKKIKMIRKLTLRKSYWEKKIERKTEEKYPQKLKKKERKNNVTESYIAQI